MSDEKTREVPLTDVMGIAEVSDEPTETLPAVDDPGEAKTESFQKPFDGGPEAQRKFESQDEPNRWKPPDKTCAEALRAVRHVRPVPSNRLIQPNQPSRSTPPSKCASAKRTASW